MLGRHCVLHFPYKQIVLKAPPQSVASGRAGPSEAGSLPVPPRSSVYRWAMGESPVMISAAGPQDWVVTSSLEK